MLKSPKSPVSAKVYVWDPFVRVFHWTLVVAFAVAYVIEDDPLIVHVWAGYVVGVLVVARIIWGFVGTPHARFSDFIYAPGTALYYVLNLLRFRGARYLGHSPGGGYMVVALLVFLAATVATGLFTKEFGESFEEVHEVIANITLALIFFHVSAVVLASFVHHENLVRAMVTGYKRK